ncbi:MAG: GatB/YqeY domain-containing protein [Dehalococcoidia bacterium]
MSLKEQLATDLTDAMRNGEETRKSTLRMLMTAINMQEVSGSERKELADDQVMQVIAKQVKQRRESIDEFQKAGRTDLVKTEEAELAVLQAYLPAQMARDEIEAEARKAIEEAGAKGPQDKGKVMQVIVPRLAGRAEGRDINEVVTQLLAAL